MTNKQRTIMICAVALLLILVMLVAVFVAHRSRQQDWWEGLYDPDADLRDDLSAAPTDKISVGVDSLMPGVSTTAPQSGGTTVTGSAGTTGTGGSAGKTTRPTAVTPATSNTPLDNEGWSEIFPDLKG